MGYLPSFIEDVFISYAHNDDDAYAMESQGWVAQLDEDLRKRVAVYLDGQKPAVWRDRDIRNNDDFEEKITGRLLTTATFLSIISPSFFQRPWCIRELEEFAASAEQGFGIKIGEKNRIFKVEKVPLSFDRSKLPNSLQGTGSYRFYGPDPEHQGKIHEYRPKLGVDYAAKYWREMDDLAQDIAMVLKDMHAKAHQDAPRPAASAPAATPTGMTVYLAETTSDLDEETKEIRRDLKARGFTVLPEGDLPYRTRDLKTKVMEDLSHAQISIQLIGNEYGYIPEGQSEKSAAWLQNEYAIEHQNQTPGFLRLLWMPPGLAPTDARQQRLVEYLHNDADSQHGADLIQSKLEDLKTVVQEKVKILRENQEKKRSSPVAETAQSVADDEPLRVYVICDQRDLASRNLRDLKSYLFSQGYECILPSDNDDERESLQEHADNLAECDACMIYYGQGSERWFGTKLRELRKLLSQRSQPVRAKAVYVAPPEAMSKTELQTLEAIVLRGAEIFEPSALTPFLSRLQPAAKGQGA
jgi:uncharacterized protein Smg (DUF494 family)